MRSRDLGEGKEIVVSTEGRGDPVRILALETSTEPLAVAASEGKRVLVEFAYLYPERRHAELLFPLLRRAVAEAGWTPEDVDLIAVARGPGSFTGVRLGLTAAKVLAWALGKPLVAVSTLELWAASVAGASSWAAPVLDARNDNVYAALYRVETRDGLPLPVLADRKAPFSEFLADVRGAWEEHGNPPIVFAGTDLAPFAARIRAAMGSAAALFEPPVGFPRAAVLAALAARKVEEGRTDPFTVQPAYFRSME